MKYKMGIYGSAVSGDSHILETYLALGRELAKTNTILITGASTGVPYTIAEEAAKHGAEIWGYSPELDTEAQKRFAPECDLSIYKKIIYIPKEFVFSSDPDVCKKYRNVISTAHCDAGIIVSGRWGTMNEFTNLYDMGKVIGVLTGTGGVADELENLSKKITKQSKAVVLYNNSPEQLVTEIFNELSRKT